MFLICLLVFIGFLVIVRKRIVLLATVVSEEMSEKKAAARKIVNKLKIIVVSFQIIAVSVMTLDTRYPNEVNIVFNQFWMTFNFNLIWPVDCWNHQLDFLGISPTPHATGLVVYTLAPIIICMTLFVASFCISRFMNEGTKSHRRQLKSIAKGCIASSVLLLFCVYPSVSSTVLGTFYADYYNSYWGKGFVHGGKLAKLVADYETETTEPQYRNFMVPYASICILIYPIGVPALFLCLLYQKIDRVDPVVLPAALGMLQSSEENAPGDSKKHHGRGLNLDLVKAAKVEGERLSVRAGEYNSNSALPAELHGRRYINEIGMIQALEMRRQDHTISHLTFLIDQYEPQFWYWEVVQCIYRLLMANLHMVTGTNYQTLSTFVLAIVYWKALATYKPYTYDMDDFLSDIGQGVVVSMLTLIIAMDFMGLSPIYAYAFIVFVILIIVVALVVTFKDTTEERKFLWSKRNKLLARLRDVFLNRNTKKKGNLETDLKDDPSLGVEMEENDMLSVDEDREVQEKDQSNYYPSYPFFCEYQYDSVLEDNTTI